ncbi:tRNA methylthiotransferase YqeV [Porphyromonas sp. oral taxon 278 str. W7784]|uniref:tRNA (N(6)-L-threonylcarbamoyladenosine(37)-C(2))- methylthiotransferase MtaB n=1 Tax=Porphyromonas sp. oral taxon 278 TaxID=712437 RepID=UPI0003AD32D9|nr:tRNA (N(6)-L-threonylcarbamoyladenosine(37)-C(2))-methylthiotransferase MtaB [Porphyromonas sp. oral taxon 278]ERJ73146.1 tRNA methylthiotransferase YqeV [Porphyromonas sp. oral taxon 278 str. W7784]
MTDTSVFEDKKAAYYTLGCKLNFAETSTIGRALLAQGIRSVRPQEEADICVINTCSVTELADKKCRTMIRKAAREHPGAFVIVTGCYAQLSPEEVADIEGVDLVIGAEKKLDLAEYLDLSSSKPSSASIIHSRTKEIRSFRLSSSSDERTRHFLKVQDGCDYHCTYCTIPKARGRSRSGSVSEIVAEAERIASVGGREIVLTGVNIGDFGRGRGEDFFDLIRALDQVEGIERFRIGSIEPNLLSEKIIEYCARSRRIAPHFHIPLQSGSDEVLRLMKRRYDTELFRSRVSLIQELLPQAFIGIDVIVGTRGEEAGYFEDCYRFLESIPFSQLHVFSYSEREGTAALTIDHVVSPQDKHRRSQRLMQLSEERLKAFYRSNLGRELTVIWEHGNYNGLMMGHSENYIRVAQPYDEEAIGTTTHLTPQHLDASGTFVL